MAVKTIQVTQVGTALELSDVEVEIALGDKVVWEFSNISPHHLPFIAFHGPSENSQSFLGPFFALAPSADRVVGRGNSGSQGLHHYRALVLSPDGPVVSGAARINNLADAPDISPAAHVVFAPGSPPEVTPTPQTQRVARGGVVVWSVENLPDGAFVTLDFASTTDPFPDRLKGPFLDMLSSRGPGSSLIVIGVGLLSGFPARPNDPIHYLIAVRNAQGDVLATSPDPVIEPVGDPPTP
jgi:hypothetical protein